jgi:plastocyanin
MNKIRGLFKMVLLGVALASLSRPFSSRAAIANVQVGNGLNNAFIPATTNIAVNDQVLWTWGGNNHDVASTNGAWTTSPLQGAGKTFTNTFAVAGTYFYYCTIHGTATTGMKGAIIVTAPNVPPSVTVANPASGAVFAAPANVTIQASASDSDGTVTNVRFLVDANVVTNKATAPFAAVTNNLAVGSHTLSVIASDNNGATATNSAAISVVTPLPMQLNAPQAQPPGKFRFSYTANPGLSYVVERSTNLPAANWLPLITNTAGGSSINFTDANATFNPGFYRVRRQPNP